MAILEAAQTLWNLRWSDESGGCITARCVTVHRAEPALTL